MLFGCGITTRQMRSEKKPVGQLTRAQLLIPPLMNSKSRMSHFYLSGLVSLLIKINNIFFFFFFFLFYLPTLLWCSADWLMRCFSVKQDKRMLVLGTVFRWCCWRSAYCQGWHSREARDSIYCSAASGHYITASLPLIFPFWIDFIKNN